jgi:hypothetical protein
MTWAEFRRKWSRYKGKEIICAMSIEAEKEQLRILEAEVRAGGQLE